MPDRGSLSQRLARRALVSLMFGLRGGQLCFREDGRETWFGSEAGATVPPVIVEIRDPAFYPAVLLRGSIGAAESYFDSLWTCDDLSSLFGIMSANGPLLDRMRGGWGRLAAPMQRLSHAWRKNTRQGSRRNIHAHYDLGNEFFELFLDKTMAYSCGIFPSERATLEEASSEKIDVVCRKLNLGPDDHVLEIGCGWGGFAIHAAREYGCRVTGTTISRAQYDYALARVRAAGLEDRVSIIMQDYRDLTGQYDKLVSIEMIEAVGYEYFDTFFGVCSERLRPGGQMLLQSITIADDAFHPARRTVDVIKKYIFPGSCIPSRAEISRSLHRATNLSVSHAEDIAQHYAQTLRHWRENLLRNASAARQLGFDDRFLRLWEFYFSYCEGGFRQERINVSQLLLYKEVRPAGIRQ